MALSLRKYGYMLTYIKPEFVVEYMAEGTKHIIICCITFRTLLCISHSSNSKRFFWFCWVFLSRKINGL